MSYVIKYTGNTGNTGDWYLQQYNPDVYFNRFVWDRDRRGAARFTTRAETSPIINETREDLPGHVRVVRIVPKG